MTKKILIAEDNELNIKLMSDVLEASGYLVDKVYDGVDAVKKIQNFEYNLLILDIQMPKKSGFDVLKEIRKDIKVLVVSACAMGCEIEQAKSIREIDYMTKPIRVAEFLKKVKILTDM